MRETSAVDLLSELNGRTAEALRALANVNIVLANPTAASEPVSIADRSIQATEHWEASLTALDETRGYLRPNERAAADLASEQLLWVARVFERWEAAECSPTPDGLAALAYSGVQLGWFDAASSRDARSKKPVKKTIRYRSGRPTGSGFAAQDKRSVRAFITLALAQRSETEAWDVVCDAIPDFNKSVRTRLQRQLRAYMPSGAAKANSHGSISRDRALALRLAQLAMVEEEVRQSLDAPI